MAKSPLIKQANVDDTLTPEQEIEVIKCAKDPMYFMRNYMRVQHPTRGAVLFDLYPYQERIIQSIIENDKTIILAPRQCGKTIGIVGYLLWMGIFQPDKTIGIAAHKGSGAKEFIKRIRYAYESLPLWLKPGVVNYNVFDISFDNGSSIISATTTENTFRGMSMSAIALDEFAFVPPRIAEEFWTSLLPSLSAGESDENGPGVKLIITSTPNGSEGKFASLWFGAENNENGFKAVKVYNDEVPGRGPDFKAKMLRGGNMTPTKYAQEYEMAFLSDKGTLIQSEILEAVRPVEPIKVHEGIKVYKEIENRRLGVTVDVGEGIGQDYSVIQVFDIDKLEQIAQYRDNTSGLTELAKKIIKTLEYLEAEGAKEIFYTVEANPIGKGVIVLLENADNPILERCEFVSEYGKKHRGILTTNKNKLEGCGKLKDLFECGKLKIYSRELLSELKFFVKSGGSFKAETGMTDDIVMSVVIMMNMLSELAYQDDDIHDNINTFTFDPEDEDEGEPMPFVF